MPRCKPTWPSCAAAFPRPVRCTVRSVAYCSSTAASRPPPTSSTAWCARTAWARRRRCCKGSGRSCAGARVTIDHPDLPESLKQVAAEAVKTIWQAANEAANGELATLRAEARHAASAAEAERDAARAETAAARAHVAAGRSRSGARAPATGRIARGAPRAR